MLLHSVHDLGGNLITSWVARLHFCEWKSLQLGIETSRRHEVHFEREILSFRDGIETSVEGYEAHPTGCEKSHSNWEDWCKQQLRYYSRITEILQLRGTELTDILCTSMFSWEILSWEGLVRNENKPSSDALCPVLVQWGFELWLQNDYFFCTWFLQPTVLFAFWVWTLIFRNSSVLTIHHAWETSVEIIQSSILGRLITLSFVPLQVVGMPSFESVALELL